SLSGNVTLTAGEASPAATGDDLTINGTSPGPAVTVESTGGGTVLLQAGDNVDVQAGSRIATTATITINGAFGNNDPAAPTITLAGDLDAASAIVNGDTN